MTATRFARWIRRHVAVLLLAGVGVFALAGVAAAFWNIGVNSSPQGSAKGAQLTTPSSPNATVNPNGSVTVTWAHPVGELTGANYSVTRTGGTEGSTVICNSSATTCTDNGPLTPAALYTYSIRASLGTNWVSPAATATATAETPSLTIALAFGPYTAGTPINVSSITAQVAGVTDVTYGASGGTGKSITWGGLANSPAPSNRPPIYPSGSVTFTSGVASPGTSVTAYAAGSNTLTATDAAVSAVTGSNTFTVNPSSATTLSVSGLPASQTAGTPETVTVTAKDTYGNTATGYAGTVHFTSTDAQATAGSGLPANYTFTTGSGNDNGVHTFTNGVTLKTAGSQTVTATDTGTSSITGSESTTVNPSTATTIAVSSGSAQSATVNTAFNNPLVAKVTDTYGNPVSGASVLFTAPGSGANGTFLASSNGGTCLSSGGSAVASCTATTNASGLASSLTFTANATAGTYNVAATSSGTTPNPLNFSETNTAGTASKLAFTPATPGPGTAGSAISNVAVSVEDTFGNVVTTASGSVVMSIKSGSPQASFTSGTTTVALSSGVATFSNLVVNTSGSYTFTATPSSISGVSTAVNSNAFTVSPTSASKLAFTPATPGPGTAGSAISNVAVSVEDTFGNVVTTASGSVVMSIKSGSPQASFTSGTTTVALSSGVATFSNLVVNTSGSYTFTATPSSISGVSTAVNSNAFTVSPTSASKLAFTPATPGPGTAGSAISNVAVSVEDTFGNVVTTASGSVVMSIKSGSPQASFTSGTTTVALSSGVATFSNLVVNTSGSYTFTATPSSISGVSTAVNSNAFTVSPTSASKLAFTPATPGPGTAGSAISNVAVSVEDTFGNVVTTASGSVVMSIKSGSPQASFTSGTTTVALSSGVATFSNLVVNTSGSYTFTATPSSISGVSTAVNSNAFTVAGASPATLVLANCSINSGTPGSCTSPYSLGSSGNLVANVQALDQFGNAATISSTITLSVSSSSSSNYSIASGASLTIDGTATPPNQSTTTFKVQKSGSANNSATITVHVVSGATGVPDLTFIVQKQ